MTPDTQAGRSCPLHDQYGPEVFALAPDAQLNDLDAHVDVFASTHTCLPVFQQVQVPGRAQAAWVLNNGAAGMPNFQGDAAGLLTRIAHTPLEGPQRRCAVQAHGLHLEAIAIETPAAAAQARFLQQWPEGSDAHASYFSRIAAGPAYSDADVIRWET